MSFRFPYNPATLPSDYANNYTAGNVAAASNYDVFIKAALAHMQKVAAQYAQPLAQQNLLAQTANTQKAQEDANTEAAIRQANINLLKAQGGAQGGLANLYGSQAQEAQQRLKLAQST